MDWFQRYGCFYASYSKANKEWYQKWSWGSGPLLCMAQVLVPVEKLLMSMLTIILLVEYYTLKQAAEIELVVQPVSMSLGQWQSGSRLK
jgi:hypothetical protein